MYSFVIARKSTTLCAVAKNHCRFNIFKPVSSNSACYYLKNNKQHPMNFLLTVILSDQCVCVCRKRTILEYSLKLMLSPFCVINWDQGPCHTVVPFLPTPCLAIFFLLRACSSACYLQFWAGIFEQCPLFSQIHEPPLFSSSSFTSSFLLFLSSFFLIHFSSFLSNISSIFSQQYWPTSRVK